MTDQLRDRIALVTGGAQGIGAAVVRRFQAEGAKVVTADVAGLENAPGDCVMACDVRKPDQVHAVVDETVRRFGRIDILINNAGLTGGTGKFLDITLSDWQRYIDVNLTGCFIVGQAVARVMKAGGTPGRIVNIGSINSFAAEEDAPQYVASKGGVLLLTKAMAVELARYNILVNCIAPGAITVDRNRAIFAAEPLHTGLINAIPLGRTGTGDDIAAAALFLSSEDNRYITGESLLVDGGYMAVNRFA